MHFRVGNTRISSKERLGRTSQCIKRISLYEKKKTRNTRDDRLDKTVREYFDIDAIGIKTNINIHRGRTSFKNTRRKESLYWKCVGDRIIMERRLRKLTK